MIEQLAFCLDDARIARERAVGADDAMAWHDDRERRPLAAEVLVELVGGVVEHRMRSDDRGVLQALRRHASPFSVAQMGRFFLQGAGSGGRGRRERRS